MNYRNVANLNALTREWPRRLPRDIELIVGIPRSGLLAANLLALHMNLPLADLDGLAAGRVFTSGPRCPVEKNFLGRARNILVVDDSVLYGTQMTMAREMLRETMKVHRVQFAAVYVQPGSEKHVDYWGELVPRPRVFEWHLMHHNNLQHWCVDIDGVLCDDPTEAENDDGEIYLRFIAETPPRIIPSKEIGWLVTCRLEKYREATEKWLRCHGIRYRNLIMMDYPDAASRRSAGHYGRFKAEVYRQSGAPLFIESSPAQAAEIARRSGKSVFCFESQKMVSPRLIDRALHQPRATLKRALQMPVGNPAPGGGSSLSG